MLEWNRFPKVELFGQLETSGSADVFKQILGNSKRVPVVLGESWDQRPISLWEASIDVHQMSMEAPDEADTLVESSYALVGAHYPNQDVSFQKALIRIEHLLEFAGATKIELDSKRSRRPGVKFRQQWRSTKGRTYRTSKARIEIGTSAVARGERIYVGSIEQWSDAVVRLGHPLELAAILEDYVFPLRNLVTFAAGRRCAIELLTLEERLTPGQAEVEVVSRRDGPDKENAVLGPGNLLFSLTDAPAEGGDIMQRWLEFHAAHRDVVNLYLSTRYATFMYEQNRFLNLVQAAEALHRLDNGDFKPDTDEDKQRRDAVVASAPPDHLAWLTELLDADRRYTTADRLRGLLSEEPWMKGDVFPNASTFIDRIKETRNLHTHWDRRSSARALTGGDLFAACEALIVLLEARLLSALGFDADQRAEAIRHGSRSYRALKLNQDAVSRAFTHKKRGALRHK